MAFSEFHRRLLTSTDQGLDHGLNVLLLEGLRSPALFIGDGRFQHAQAREATLILCFDGVRKIVRDFFNEGCGQRQSSED
jgi:hypothetical protein